MGGSHCPCWPALLGVAPDQVWLRAQAQTVAFSGDSLSLRKLFKGWACVGRAKNILQRMCSPGVNSIASIKNIKKKPNWDCKMYSQIVKYHQHFFLPLGFYWAFVLELLVFCFLGFFGGFFVCLFGFGFFCCRGVLFFGEVGKLS